VSAGTAAGHGTRGCYLRDCDRPECAEAHHDYLAGRKRQIAYGRWDPYADAEPVRLHLKELEAAAGVTASQAAAVAGVSHTRVIELMQGKVKRIRHDKAEKLLAMTVESARQRDCLLADATGTVRRLQSLMAYGWTRPMLAAALGISKQCLAELLTRRRVQEKTRRAVRELYDRDIRPPVVTARDRTESERTRRDALAAGWAPPLAWDDEEIDDPAAQSHGVIIPGRRKGSVVLAQVADLAVIGVTDRAEVADRLSISKDALDKALSRAARRAAGQCEAAERLAS
jgi:DNA-binding Xre family transcriptional regulator